MSTPTTPEPEGGRRTTTTRSASRESGGAGLLNAALLETFDAFKQKHVKQNREIIHKNAELLRTITDLNRTVRTCKADQLADAIRSKIKIAQLENELRASQHRELEWRRRAEGTGNTGVSALRSALGGIIGQLTGLEVGLGSSPTKPKASSLPLLGEAFPQPQIRRCPSRSELQASREPRPSTLAAGGRPDLSLIAEGSTDEDDEPDGKSRVAMLPGISEDRSASPSPAAKAPPVVHVDISRRTGRRQSSTQSVPAAVPFPSNAPSVPVEIPPSSSASSISSMSSSSSSSSVDVQLRLRPPSTTGSSGTETERDAPRRRPLSGIVVSNVSTRVANRRMLGRVAAPTTSETEAEGDVEETATESDCSDAVGRAKSRRKPRADEDDEDEDWTLTSVSANRRARVDSDDDVPARRVPTPVSPPVRRRPIRPVSTPSENRVASGGAPTTARRGAKPSLTTPSEPRTSMRDITARSANATDEPLAPTPRTARKPSKKLEAVVEEIGSPAAVDPELLMTAGRESRRARKSVNYALPSLNSKMRQPEGYVPAIKRPLEKLKTGKPRSSSATGLAGLGSPTPATAPAPAARRVSSLTGAPSTTLRRATISSSKKSVAAPANATDDLATSTSSNGSSTATSKPASTGSGGSGGARPSTTVSALHSIIKKPGATPSTSFSARTGSTAGLDADLLREFEKAMEAQAKGDTSADSVVLANGRSRRHSTAV